MKMKPVFEFLIRWPVIINRFSSVRLLSKNNIVYS